MKIRILSEAQDEIFRIIGFYDEKAAGLGLDFVEELDRVWALLSHHPEIGTRFEGEVRRLLVQRFPFSVLYSIESDELVVLAIAHQRQKPGYWKDRR